MPRWLVPVLILILAGAGINVLVAGLCAQLSQRPICTIKTAKDAAIDQIMKNANPTPPIWPEFAVKGRGVTISGRYRKDGDEYPQNTWIVVNLSVGWPMRTLTTQMAYSGQWTEPTACMDLFSTPGPRGNYIVRELPLTPLWIGSVVNTLVFALAIAVVPMMRARSRRKARNLEDRCPVCGYPIGVSPVCTECGTPLPK